MRILALALALVAALIGPSAAAAWTWPVGGEVLRPYSLGPDPYAAGQHRGIDIRAAEGESVLAAAEGVVSFAGTVPTHGRTVTVQTSDGYAVSITHLGSISVTKGVAVSEGGPIGTAGASGEPEWPSPYVHLGIRVGSAADAYVDPVTLLPPLAGPDVPAPAPPVIPVVTQAATAVQQAPPATPAAVAPAAAPGPGAATAEPAGADTAAPHSGPVPTPVEATVGEPPPAPAGSGQPFDQAPVSAGVIERAGVSEPTPAAIATAQASATELEVTRRGEMSSTRTSSRAAVEQATKPSQARAVVETTSEGALGSVSRLEDGGAASTGAAAATTPATKRLAGDGLARISEAEAQPPVSLRARGERGVPRPGGEAREWIDGTVRIAASPEGADHSYPSGIGGIRDVMLVAFAGLIALFVVVVRGARRRSAGRQNGARMMTGDVRADEDPGRCGVAVRQRTAPYRPRGGLRRAVRHLRAVPPAPRQRRPDGQRHGRAWNADHGRRRSGRHVAA